MKKLAISLLVCCVIWLNACHPDNADKAPAENTDSSETVVTVIEPDSLATQRDTIYLSPYGLTEFLTDTVLRNGIAGLYVYDDLRDSAIIAHNELLALTPASTMKLPTTGAALEILGSGHNFGTTVQYGGQLVDGHILQGNIYIKGGGDPALGSKFFRGHYGNFIEKWAAAIKEQGIDSITGGVIADAQLFDVQTTPYTWSWGEVSEYYCQAASGLSIYDNRYELRFNTNRHGRYFPSENQMTPYVPDVSFENLTEKGGSKDQYFVIGEPYGKRRTVRGKVRSSNITIEGTIPDPPYLAAWELHNALRNKGVRIGFPPVSLREIKGNSDTLYGNVWEQQRTKITATYSPSVGALVYNTNRVSNNLFAEHFLKHIGLKRGNRGDTQTGAEAIVKFWHDKGIDIGGFNMYDGSGISRYNTITARQLVEILQYMSTTAYAEAFFNSLAVSGEGGTLRHFGTNRTARGRIHAKSGSMSRVLSYAGYLETLSGQRLTFAIIVNNYNCSSREMKNRIATLLTHIIRQYKPDETS